METLDKLNKIKEQLDNLIDEIPENLKDEFNHPRNTLLQASHYLNIAYKELFNLE